MTPPTPKADGRARVPESKRATTADHLRRSRRAAGISIESLAAASGMSAASIGNYEHNKTPMTRRSVLRLVAAIQRAKDERDAQLRRALEADEC